MEDPIFMQKERDRQVVEIVRHFLLTVVTFRQQYQNYQQGSLHFSDLANSSTTEAKVFSIPSKNFPMLCIAITLQTYLKKNRSLT